MKLDKLVKQLRRELLGSPKKAAVMGVLLVVALYFWAPLVMGWCGMNETKPTGNAKSKPPVPGPGAVAAAPVAPASPSAPASAADAPRAKETVKQHPWNVLVRWIDEDTRTRPASQVSEKFNPFQDPTTAELADKPKEQGKAVEEELPIQSLNVVVSGTIVGPKQSVAQINGKTYAVGKSVPVGNKEGKPLRLTLVEVRPKGVVLESSGKRYAVPIQSYEEAAGNAVVKNTR